MPKPSTKTFSQLVKDAERAVTRAADAAEDASETQKALKLQGIALAEISLAEQRAALA